MGEGEGGEREHAFDFGGLLDLAAVKSYPLPPSLDWKDLSSRSSYVLSLKSSPCRPTNVSGVYRAILMAGAHKAVCRTGQPPFFCP